MNVGVGRYALGIAALLIVSGSLATAAVIVRRRWFGDFTGALARLAEVVIGAALLVVILELLGTIRLFRLGPIVILCAAASAAIWRWLRVPAGDAPAATPPRASTSRWLLGGFAALVSAIVAAEWAGPTLQAYDLGIHVVDSVWYHLPWAASFAQTGQITSLRFTDVEFLTAFYPATAEMLHGLGIVLIGRDTLSPAFNLPWLGLTLLAAYCVGRPRGRGPVTLLAVALVMATPMLNYSQAGSADNDTIGLFFLLAAVALVLNGGGERAAPRVLAAVAAGLAAAVKLTFLAPALALTVGVIAIAPASGRRRTAAQWLGAELLAGGFWYARNLIAVGNPLPWMSLGVLPTPAPAADHATGYSVAHYLLHPSAPIWPRFAEPALAGSLGRWWWLILALGLLGIVLSLLPGTGRTLRMLALVTIASLIAYLLTPESAGGPAGDPVGIADNLRYGAPALMLALVLLPLAPVLAGVRRQAALVVVLVATLAATVAQSPLWPERHLTGALAVGLLVFAVGAALIALRSRLLPRALAIAIAVTVAVAGVAAGYPWQRHYLRGRYAFKPGVSELSHVWAYFRGVRDARVGIVGTYIGYYAYPLYGLDDSNRVQYIAAHGRHGSFTPITNCRAWRAAVDAGHFNFLVLTPARDFWLSGVLLPSPEVRWTEGDPAAQRVLAVQAYGQQIEVFRVHGALSADGCSSPSA